MPTTLSTDQQQLLRDLALHPGWAILTAEIRAERSRRFENMARRMVRGDVPGAEEIHYERGFFAGMKHLLKNPSLQAAQLERALKGSER